MDDLTPFDHQIAAEFLRDAGPSEPVDDAAIFTAITATESPKWRSRSMFSATKFVVAGAIVALFGGFLLAGVLTQQREEMMPAPAASASTVSEDATDDISGLLDELEAALPDGWTTPAVVTKLLDERQADRPPYAVSIPYAVRTSLEAITALTAADAALPGKGTLESQRERFESATAVQALRLIDDQFGYFSDGVVDPDILPGVNVVVEEVETGVFRVLGDGVRRLTSSSDLGDITAGLDGSVVFGRVGGSGYRLGDPETFPLPDTRSNERERLKLYRLSGVGPDGTIWATHMSGQVDGLSSWDGEQWVVRDEFDRSPRGTTSVLDTAVAVDGTVWVVTIGEDPPARLLRLSDEGWELVRGTGKDLGWIASNASGDLVLVRVGDTIMRATTDGLEPFRDVGDAPEGIKEMPGDSALPPDPVVRRPAGISGDGSMWWTTRHADDFRSPTGLVRLNETGWQTFDIPDDVIEAARCNSPSVAPDGSVWIGSAAWQGCEEGSHGIHRFDGDAWTQLLPDHSGWSPVFGPHGTAWSWANRLDGTAAGLYVITPEAAGATE